MSGVPGAIAFEALVSAAFILIGSKVGDLIGRKRAYVLGLLGCALSAAAMTLAQNLFAIIVFWALIGNIGASLLLPCDAVPHPRQFRGSGSEAGVRPRRCRGWRVRLQSDPCVGGVHHRYLSWRIGLLLEVVIIAVVLRRTREAGRNTIWVGTAEDDQGARTFVEGFGFGYASHDARRRQVLANVDQSEVQRLWTQAQTAASDYCLERLRPPIADEVLSELVDVTAAINDAPMGDLTYEDEKFDLRRLRDNETALARRGNCVYRVIARHRDTGEIGGHTMVVTHPLQPEVGGQADTAVARHHRGHRLGLLLKIDMMRWLAEVEPQLKIIETWNNVDNNFMINVNEALGYRLSRIFNMYELRL